MKKLIMLFQSDYNIILRDKKHFMENVLPEEKANILQVMFCRHLWEGKTKLNPFTHPVCINKAHILC